jgi:thiol:disulfide interchange protein DsbD
MTINVLGLPKIVLFNGQVEEQRALGLTGFMDAAKFSAILRDRQP